MNSLQFISYVFRRFFVDDIVFLIRFYVVSKNRSYYSAIQNHLSFGHFVFFQWPLKFFCQNSNQAFIFEESLVINRPRVVIVGLQSFQFD